MTATDHAVSLIEAAARALADHVPEGWGEHQVCAPIEQVIGDLTPAAHAAGMRPNRA